MSKRKRQPKIRKPALTKAYQQVFMDRVIRTGLESLLEETLAAMRSALFVMCSVEIEAHSFQQRQLTPRLFEYWHGGRKAAWTIRRHASALPKLIRQLEALLPSPTTNRDKSSRTEWRRQLKRALSLKTPGADERQVQSEFFEKVKQSLEDILAKYASNAPENDDYVASDDVAALLKFVKEFDL